MSLVFIIDKLTESYNNEFGFNRNNSICCWASTLINEKEINRNEVTSTTNWNKTKGFIIRYIFYTLYNVDKQTGKERLGRGIKIRQRERDVGGIRVPCKMTFILACRRHDSCLKYYCDFYYTLYVSVTLLMFRKTQALK